MAEMHILYWTTRLLSDTQFFKPMTNQLQLLQLAQHPPLPLVAAPAVVVQVRAEAEVAAAVEAEAEVVDVVAEQVSVAAIVTAVKAVVAAAVAGVVVAVVAVVGFVEAAADSGASAVAAMLGFGEVVIAVANQQVVDAVDKYSGVGVVVVVQIHLPLWVQLSQNFQQSPTQEQDLQLPQPSW